MAIKQEQGSVTSKVPRPGQFASQIVTPTSNATTIPNQFVYPNGSFAPPATSTIYRTTGPVGALGASGSALPTRQPPPTSTVTRPQPSQAYFRTPQYSSGAGSKIPVVPSTARVTGANAVTEIGQRQQNIQYAPNYQELARLRQRYSYGAGAPNVGGTAQYTGYNNAANVYQPAYMPHQAVPKQQQDIRRGGFQPAPEMVYPHPDMLLNTPGTDIRQPIPVSSSVYDPAPYAVPSYGSGGYGGGYGGYGGYGGGYSGYTPSSGGGYYDSGYSRVFNWRVATG